MTSSSRRKVPPCGSHCWCTPFAPRMRLIPSPRGFHIEDLVSLPRGSRFSVAGAVRTFATFDEHGGSLVPQHKNPSFGGPSRDSGSDDTVASRPARRPDRPSNGPGMRGSDQAHRAVQAPAPCRHERRAHETASRCRVRTMRERRVPPSAYSSQYRLGPPCPPDGLAGRPVSESSKSPCQSSPMPRKTPGATTPKLSKLSSPVATSRI